MTSASDVENRVMPRYSVSLDDRPAFERGDPFVIACVRWDGTRLVHVLRPASDPE